MRWRTKKNQRRQRQKRMKGSPGPVYVFYDLRMMKKRKVCRSKMQYQAPLGGHNVYSSGVEAPAAPGSHAALKNHKLSTWEHL